MRKMLFYIFCAMSLAVAAQSKVSTSPMWFDMDATRLPANINFIPGSLQFIDSNNDSIIGANENCTIRFQVSNTGMGDGKGCIARISATGNTQGITYSDFNLPLIKHDEKRWVEFPVKSSKNTEDGVIHFRMEIYEPHGLGTGEILYDIPTYHFVAPMLKVTDYRILGQKSTLQRKEPFTLQILVKNTDHGVADDISIRINLPQGISLLGDNYVLRIDRMMPNEEKVVEYDLIAGINAPEKLDFLINLSEHYRTYAENRQISLRLDEKLASYAERIEAKKEEIVITGGSLTSDVDKNIPISGMQNNNTFALIIANETYQQVVNVPYAINDGGVFRQYCENTLGIPATNIHFLTDATFNNIKYEVGWLQSVMKAYKGQAKIIFYYAGHGVPDEQSKTAFLLPADGNGSDISTGYKLDDLYQSLGSMPNAGITVFLDACFSGSKREDGMLASARGVAVKAKTGQPVGNMVVFSAATGDETAYPYKQQGHGMFTYFLLKKLQETAGDVSYKDLGDYVSEQVQRQSIVLNGKSQTPTVIAAPEAIDWQQWRLK